METVRLVSGEAPLVYQETYHSALLFRTDVITAENNPDPDVFPIISITHHLGNPSERTQSIIFTEQEFRDVILPNLVKIILGENYFVVVAERVC